MFANLLSLWTSLAALQTGTNFKNLNKMSLSTLLKTPQTKFEVIRPEGVGGDTF